MFPDTYGEGAHFGDRFRIIDEMKDGRELFAHLQENLGSALETYYIAAKQWYQECGDLKVPQRYVTPTGLTLGAWIHTQRRVRSGTLAGNLTPEKIRRHDEIGMIWNVSDSGWNASA